MSFFTSLFSVSRLRRAGLALCVFALLFASCDLDPDNGKIEGLNPDIIGTWTSSSSDYYEITEDHLTYGYGTEISFAGEIVAATEFSDDDGVIIIKYDAGNEQVYYDSFDNYGDPEHIIARDGDYHAIYYNDISAGVSVKMCGAYNAADPNGPETATLDEAKAEFTQANHGTYAGSQPVYEWTIEE